MAYELFLFDLDDTLLDFKESERLSFSRTLESLNIHSALAPLYASYQLENNALWKLFEQGKTSKEHLRVERFRKTFSMHGIDIDPELASDRYLEALPQTVVLMDHAQEICEWASARGEIGIITNGIGHVQHARIQNSAIAPYISFVSVSDMCGYAKPDVRFFAHTVGMARRFDKASTIIVGDRMDADIHGAHRFGIDSCWFNPGKQTAAPEIMPTYEIAHLSELRGILASAA